MIVTTTIENLDLFPLGMTLFPDGLMALNIFEPRYLSMVKKRFQRSEPFGVITLLEGFEVNLPEQEISIAQSGTLAKIIQFEELQPALFRIKCVGLQRFKITERLAPLAGLERAHVDLLSLDPEIPIPSHLQECANALGKLIAYQQEQGVKLSQMPFSTPFYLDECGWVANRWAEILTLERATKNKLLMELDPLKRLQMIGDYLLSDSGGEG